MKRNGLPFVAREFHHCRLSSRSIGPKSFSYDTKAGANQQQFVGVEEFDELCSVVASNVLAKVSVGGLCKMTMASSTAGQRRSKLLSLGNAHVGNHISWLMILTWQVCVAQTV